ncbi:MAG: 30S ribosomal protein S18 [Elusimicrobia bacterium]|nr:30S ribosomal protein S18 [Elusimicrobiota bacterium]
MPGPGSGAPKKRFIHKKGKFSKRRKMFKKKFCRFCADKIEIDYKNIGLIKNYITERGKILSSRFTGVCVKHQRILTREIKRARNIAIIPFSNL